MLTLIYFAATLLAFWGYLIIFLQRYSGSAAFESYGACFFPSTKILVLRRIISTGGSYVSVYKDFTAPPHHQR